MSSRSKNTKSSEAELFSSSNLKPLVYYFFLISKTASLVLNRIAYKQGEQGPKGNGFIAIKVPKNFRIIIHWDFAVPLLCRWNWRDLRKKENPCKCKFVLTFLFSFWLLLWGDNNYVYFTEITKTVKTTWNNLNDLNRNLFSYFLFGTMHLWMLNTF